MAGDCARDGALFCELQLPSGAGWFDEGLAEYFGSVEIGKEVNIGGDPELAPEWHEDIFDQMRRDASIPQSLTQLASSPVWIAMPDLFTMKHDATGMHEGSHNTMYYAQSWMVVHYLLNKKKMPEVGQYFDLVLNQKVPVDKAMVQAFDMTPAQMEEAVKTYFGSLSNLGIALDQAKKPVVLPGDIPQPDHFAVPIDDNDVGMAVSALPEKDANAVIGDVMARIPEHREQALHDLQQLATDPKEENESAHRGLARDHLQQNLFDQTADELDKATELNPRDPWIWYYRSVLKYRKAQAMRQDIQGLANMMQDLRAVLDWYPDMADAYNMLGVTRLEGGGINSALEAQKEAIALSPRNVEYQFNLGQIYIAGKKWEQARDVFTRIKDGADRQAAAAAKRQLEDIATLQKYGIRPQRAGELEAPAGAASTPSASSAGVAKAAAASQSAGGGEDEDAAPKPAPVKPGSTGPVLFLKGKIVNSDCSKAPEAAITVLSGMTTYTMHTSDYKTLVMVGDEPFSCEWKNRPVSVNYRATGKREGEVVSIEAR